MKKKKNPRFLNEQKKEKPDANRGRRRSSFVVIALLLVLAVAGGKTRWPRSTFVCVPSISSRLVRSSWPNWRTAALRNLLLRGTWRKKSSASQALVTLHLPFPVMKSFFPNFSLCSYMVTFAPASAAATAGVAF